MNLRNMGIGARLWLGIGAILLSTGLMWVVSNASHQRERSASAAALALSQARQAILMDMRQALMASAIAVRNMGLSDVVEAVQAAQAEAHLQREKYLASMGKLERNTLSGAEKTLIEQLRAIDNTMDQDFKEAVGLASQFNTEQAAKIIVGKIDPASARSIEHLNQLLVLQDRRAAAEAAQHAAQAAAVQRAVGIAGAVVMLLAGLGVWALTRSIVRPLRVAMGVASTVASGDLTSRIEVLGQDETGRLLTSLQAMNAQLRSMVGQIQTSTESLARASSEVSTGNQELSTRTERTASSLDEVASLLERMTAQVTGLAEAAHQSQQLVAGAAELAGSGGTVVARVIDTMQEIQASSGRMATIVGVIDAIAFQTNILALNAAVEAARAGDQGRGFAVVAGEVRTLAQRSAQSAREIKALIEASIDKVEAGSRLVVDAGDTMQRIVASVGEVKSVIGEITSAAQMQRDGIAEINASVTPINDMTQQNSALVEQSAAATESMREQCQRLSGLVGEFHLG